MGTVERLELVEVFAVMDTYVSGLGSVEDIGGGNWRFTFFTAQDICGRHELVVTAKIIMSIEALPAAIHLAAKTTSICACESAMALVRH